MWSMSIDNRRGHFLGSTSTKAASTSQVLLLLVRFIQFLFSGVWFGTGYPDLLNALFMTSRYHLIKSQECYLGQHPFERMLNSPYQCWLNSMFKDFITGLFKDPFLCWWILFYLFIYLFFMFEMESDFILILFAVNFLCFLSCCKL